MWALLCKSENFLVDKSELKNTWLLWAMIKLGLFLKMFARLAVEQIGDPEISRNSSIGNKFKACLNALSVILEVWIILVQFF